MQHPDKYLSVNGAFKKLNPEFIKWSFEKEGYTLLDDYKNDDNALLRFICPHGHHYHISWSNWRSGRRCRLCSHNRKLTYEIVKNAFSEVGYTPLINQKFNSVDYISYVCSRGHEHQMLWRNFKAGVRCPYCRYGMIEEESGELFSKLERHGYKLIKPYIKYRFKIVYKTPDGVTHQGFWRHIKKRLYKQLEKLENEN